MGEQTEQRQAVFIRRSLTVGADPPVLYQRLAFEQSEHNIGVAHIHNENHSSSLPFIQIQADIQGLHRIGQPAYGDHVHARFSNAADRGQIHIP
ncbi:hypothetical protein D3C81_1569390 [compost metagenome]